MVTRPMVGCRIPTEWKERLEAIGQETGRNTAQVVYEAIERFLEGHNQSTHAQVKRALKDASVLEGNQLIASLLQRIQAVEDKLETVQKMISHFSSSSLSDKERGKITLTAEELAVILKVTPRSVNLAAAKGQEHFKNWTKRHRKNEEWGFEVINPGGKKCDRRFFSIH